MEQKLNLTISKPCLENFSEFTSTPKGGFCKSCQKEVIDFRSMSDKKIIEYFKNNKAKTCGYFNVSQLDRDFQIPQLKQSPRFKYLRVVAVAFLSLTSLHHIQALEQKSKTEIVESPTISSKVDKSATQDSLLSGTVLEENGPLPGANIVLKGTTIGTVANFDGEFIFPKALKAGDVLVVSFIGYVTKEIEIKKEQTELNAILNIKMQEDISCVLLGEVDVNEAYQSKRTFWQKIKDIF